MIAALSDSISKPWFQNFVTNTAGITLLTSVCAYGGTFFFSNYNPAMGAEYIGLVTLVSHIAYQILEKMKEFISSKKLKNMITLIQLFQIPIFFYFLPGSFIPLMTAKFKLEIIIMTAHFAAIPMFFHIAIQTWEDRTLTNITATAGIMLSLTNGLRHFLLNA